ncbi:FBP domain-containing protein [Sanguibacter sp. 25GB23B1]|uniref:FBP domain-containing protein n=1 Tax=unclassified Sanguibacter TaxID=2645534 RepID=UPI0032AF4D4F
MKPLTEAEIRRSVVNGSRKDAASIVLPASLPDLDWDTLDYLSWRDPRAPQRGYIVGWRDDRPVGVILRKADSSGVRPRSSLCQLCQSLHSTDDVSLFSARRAGQAGRDFNTVGTLICSDLVCSTNVRVLPPPEPLRPDPQAVVADRIAGLVLRTDAFFDSVLRG